MSVRLLMALEVLSRRPSAYPLRVLLYRVSWVSRKFLRAVLDQDVARVLKSVRIRLDWFISEFQEIELYLLPWVFEVTMKAVAFTLAFIAIISSSRASVPPKIAFLGIPETSIGSEATLLCSLGSGTKPIQFRWTKDGKEVDHSLVIHHEEKGYSTIFIKSVNLQDRGRYTCYVKSSFGEDSKPGDLVINGGSCTSLLIN